LDWKVNLSDNKDRLTEHLIAFANHPNGGFLVYGVADAGANLVGIDQIQVEEIIRRLANLGRDTIDPPLVLDHAVVDYGNTPLLLVYIPEQLNKPVHKRAKSIEEAWIRSGGTTRKAARSDVGSLMHAQPCTPLGRVKSYIAFVYHRSSRAVRSGNNWQTFTASAAQRRSRVDELA
jgi:predicted HTH transcriptional regulator